jgi:hypothetical protein
MTAVTRASSGRAVGAVLSLTAVATVAYWLVFFTSGEVQSSEDACYLVFERAFPAADGWMAVSCVLAAVGLWRRREWAVLWGVAAGSALIYLGCMDVLYNLENGMYRHLSGAMAGELLINAWCLTVGPFALAYFWRHRGRVASETRK